MLRNMMLQSEEQLAAELALLEGLYPNASNSELMEIKSTLDRYFDIGLEIFAERGEDPLLHGLFDGSTRLSYDQDIKVEPTNN